MKRTGIRMKRNRRKFNFVIIIVFYVVLPVMAIYIGLHITQSLVEPALNQEDVINEILQPVDEEGEVSLGDDEDQNIPTTKENTGKGQQYITLQIRPLSIYAVQIASTSTTENMEDFISKLNLQKLSHLIYRMDNSYKVYTLGATKRDFVEQYLENIRELYPDAYISEIHLPIKKLSVAEEDQEVVEAIVNNFNNLIDVLDKLSNEWYNFLREKGDLTTYKELLLEQQQLLEELSNEIKAQDVQLPETLPRVENIEKMIHYQQSNINQTLEILGNNEEAHKVHSLFLDSLFRVVEVIK